MHRAAPNGAEETPLPTELAKLKVVLIRRKVEWGKARRSGQGITARPLALLQLLLARLNVFRPMRAWQHYSLAHGPLMSAGIGFTMFFSITGLLATGFSVVGLVLTGQPALVDAIIANIAESAPGLLKTDGGEGLVDPRDLLNPGGLGLTAVIAAAVTLFTSLGWIAGMRDGLRGVADVPPLKRNPLLLKLSDAGTLLLLGVALVASSGVSIVFGTAATWLIGQLGLDERVAEPAAAAVKLVVPLLLNWATAVVMFRLAGGLKLVKRAFLEGTILAAVGTTVLQVFSTELLARAGQNPILAPFAIIIGLLIWFNLVSQVYLFSAAWSAIREADLGAAEHKKTQTTLGSRPVPL
ncbi:YihY/virulence factor BrkB family protein [Arthrobacter cupressi]|uniref:Membrane protein n=1 Tax=Arthrobacter cupressi TaxID=1045773 RepID=A0A1G8ILB5_9MICC|nr:YihY/virulence factor BrkB family protein [Arthrobacter cupressi]NYD79057.1 membrane protein [Arthrobacter cupressi]SDI19759.1 membrane protein [Arthrobacter cupressi]